MEENVTNLQKEVWKDTIKEMQQESICLFEIQASDLNAINL